MTLLLQIEENILETLTWQTGSPVFAAINVHGVPKCQDVTADSPVMAPVYFMSPTNVRMNKDGITQSPNVNLADRFNNTPPTTPAKRDLFGATSTVEATLLDSPNKTTTAVVLPAKTTGKIIVVLS